MNKIEELEKQLKEEMSKIQVDLKEKYKWIVGKYAKYNDSFITRIDDIHHIPMFSKNALSKPPITPGISSLPPKVRLY